MLTIPHRALVCLRENYPSDVEGYTATYLASEEQKNRPNLYSYFVALFPVPSPQ